MSHSIAQRAEVMPWLNLRTLSLGFGLGIVYFYFLAERSVDRSGLYHLYFLGLVQVTPFILALSRKKFDYVSFVLIAHFIQFTVPIFNSTVNLEGLDSLPPYTVMAVDEVLRCTFFILIAYYCCRYLFFYGFHERARYELLSMSLRLYILVALFASTVALFLNYLPAIVLIVYFTLLSADMVLLFSSTIRGRDAYAGMIRFLVLLSGFIYYFKTGMMSMVGGFAMYLFVSTCILRKYRNFIFLGVLVLWASAGQTVKHDFRSAIRGQQLSLVERVTVFVELIEKEYFSDEAKEMGNREEKLAAGFNRVGDDSLSRILEMTPRKVPFWNGETYASIPFMFIPRFLWPEKPSRHFWNKFGRLYEYLSEDDYLTSVSVGFLGEGYMNFGFVGMYTIAILFGLLIASIERVSYFFLGGHFMFTYVVLLLPVMTYSQDLGSIINSVFYVSVIILVLRPFLLKMAKWDVYC